MRKMWELLRREGSCCSPAFMVAAAWREIDADRGDPVGDSARGMEEASPFMVGKCVALEVWPGRSSLGKSRRQIISLVGGNTARYA